MARYGSSNDALKILARKEGSPSMCNHVDGACTAQASGGCTPPQSRPRLGKQAAPSPIASPTIRNAPISCLPWHGVCREIRVPCTGSGPIRGRGEQRRRRGGARSRAISSDSRPLSERSVPAGREVSWPCAPAPSSATQSARRADRTPGPEPVQGTRISRATFLARIRRARTTRPTRAKHSCFKQNEALH